MPEIPRYERSQVVAGSANLGRVTPDNTAEKVIAETGQQIQKFSEKIDKINQFRIITEASIGLQRDLNELKVRASEETDIEKKKQYASQVDDVVNKWSNKVGEVGNSETRAEFSRSSLFTGENSRIAINNDYRQSVIQSAKDSLSLSVMNAIEKAKSLDASSIIDANKLVDDSVNRAIDVGAITAAAGEELRVKAAKDVTMSYLYTVADDNLETAQEEIDSGAYNLDYEEKDALEKYIKVKRTENEVALKKTLKSNEDDVLTKYITGESVYTTDKVSSLLSQGMITTQFAKSMNQMITSVKRVDARTRDLAYIEVTNEMQKVLDMGNKITLEEMAKFRNYVMDKHANGLLSQASTQTVLADTNQMFNDLLNGEVNSIYKNANSGSIWETVKDWAGKNADDKDASAARMQTNIMSFLRDGDEPDLAVQKAYDIEYNNLLVSRVGKKQPQIIVNPDTGERLYSYDNGVTWKSSRGEIVE